MRRKIKFEQITKNLFGRVRNFPKGVINGNSQVVINNKSYTIDDSFIIYTGGKLIPFNKILELSDNQLFKLNDKIFERIKDRIESTLGKHLLSLREQKIVFAFINSYIQRTKELNPDVIAKIGKRILPEKLESLKIEISQTGGEQNPVKQINITFENKISISGDNQRLSFSFTEKTEELDASLQKVVALSSGRIGIQNKKIELVLRPGRRIDDLYDNYLTFTYYAYRKTLPNIYKEFLNAADAVKKLRNYLTINEYGEFSISFESLRELIKNKNLFNEFLNLEIILHKVKRITASIKDALFENQQTEEIIREIKLGLDYNDNFQPMKESLEIILDEVITFNLEKNGAEFKLIEARLAEKLESETIKRVKSDLKGKYLPIIKDVLNKKKSAQKQARMAEGTIMQALNRDLLKKILKKCRQPSSPCDPEAIKLEDVLKQALKHRYGKVFPKAESDAIITELVKEILKLSGFINLTVKKFLEKPVFGKNLNLSSRNKDLESHKNSYEVATQRIANAYQ